MKEKYIQQEIMFFLNNKFSQNLLCEKNESKDKPAASAREQMADACWNGLLADLLPEISIKVDNKPITIWEVQEAQNSFLLQLGTLSVFSADDSINPYRFMLEDRYN